MTPTVIIRASGFRAYCTELSRISGKDYRYVLVSEAASSVKIAALKSPIASKAKIEKQIQEREGHNWETTLGEYSANTRDSAGRVWFWDKTLGQLKGRDRAERAQGPSQPGQRHTREVVSSGAFFMLFDAGPSRGWHVHDALWQDYVASRYQRREIVKTRVKEVLKRRGIERLSWLQIGDALGVRLADVAPQGNLREDIARAATVRGRQFKNATVIESTHILRFQITIQNASPVAIKRFGQMRLDSAINQRRRAFEIAAKKGLFDDLANRAKRYPGIFVRPA